MDPEETSTRWTGKDSRPTTQKELWGWYSCGLAAEVFAVCGVGSFLPVTLEQLARENGVLLSDKKTPCVQFNTALQTRGLARRDDNQCVISVLGHEVNSSSFALYSFSLAILVQTLVLISIGAIADYGGNRKKLFLAFNYMGATASMLYILVFPAIYLFGVLLTIIAVASLGSVFVLLNSFLPLLVATHPSISNDHDGSDIPLDPLTFDNDNEDVNDDSASNGLLQNRIGFNKYKEPGAVSPALQLSNQISSKGVGIGYAAAVFVQILSIGIILLYNKFSTAATTQTWPMRTVLFIVGLWWACFTFPTAWWLHRRPGPPLPSQTVSRSGIRGGITYIIFAWSSLWQTMKIAMQLRQVVLFLIAWFVLSDGIATISGTAILFARTELDLGTAGVAVLSITATASGILGAFYWPKIGKRYNLNSISVVIACVIIYEIVPLYGLAGFLPFLQNLGVGGLQQWWELYPLGFILGFVMGGISSYCRSIYGALIPPGMEASFYALYAVTDKGSSVIGPAIVGRIIDATGSVRMGFWFLAVVMILPAPLFWLVDVEKGRIEGIEMASRRGKRRLG
ncbi:autophagy-related protein 22-1 [Microthyrium microscopicum]|uniref:Autophagy-related protein n=1 Tax=Microthyrium microscopicum TaxID=703497 RepID=A0A6A6UPQ0_9PEZI|nr:autophagy-related protein 22-1 [Microthyrium microscopicum]